MFWVRPVSYNPHWRSDANLACQGNRWVIHCYSPPSAWASDKLQQASPGFTHKVPAVRVTGGLLAQHSTLLCASVVLTLSLPPESSRNFTQPLNSILLCHHTLYKLRLCLCPLLTILSKSIQALGHKISVATTYPDSSALSELVSLTLMESRFRNI